MDNLYLTQGPWVLCMDVYSLCLSSANSLTLGHQTILKSITMTPTARPWAIPMSTYTGPHPSSWMVSVAKILRAQAIPKLGKGVWQIFDNIPNVPQVRKTPTDVWGSRQDVRARNVEAFLRLGAIGDTEAILLFRFGQKIRLFILDQHSHAFRFHRPIPFQKHFLGDCNIYY